MPEKKYIHFQEHLQKVSPISIPIPCMGLVYLVTFTIKINGFHRQIYRKRPMDPMVVLVRSGIFQVEGGFMDDKWEIIKVPGIPWIPFYWVFLGGHNLAILQK